jgi:hypothetical protein
LTNWLASVIEDTSTFEIVRLTSLKAFSISTVAPLMDEVSSSPVFSSSSPPRKIPQTQSLALFAADGVTKVADITVVSTEDGQRINCVLASAVPAGTYNVRLVSHGLDPTAPLVTALHKVTVKAGTSPVVDPPRIDGAASQGEEDGVIDAPGGAIDVTGTNLESATSISLYYGDDGAPIENMTHWTDLPATYDPESGILSTTEGPDEDAPDFYGRVKVTTAGGSADYPVRYSGH